MAERRLSLHVSALSDSEYDFYTSCFRDLVADGDGPTTATGTLTQDEMTDGAVGVREARAWIRGRFPNVHTADVDTILKYFSPSLAHADTLDAGQFFAALRLVIHADEEGHVDRGLAFVQARPPAKPRSRSVSPSKAPPQRVVSQPGVLPKRAQPPVPPPAPRSQSQTRTRTTSSSNNPFLTSDATPTLPPLPPRKPQPPPPPHRVPVVTSHVTTPLMQQSLQASKVGSALKQAEKLLEKERVMQVLKSSNPSSVLGSRRSTSPSKSHPGVPHSSSSSSSERGREAPPLPRRRTLHLTPSHSPALSTSSWEQVASATLPSSQTSPKRPPPLPSKSSKPKPPPIPPKPPMSASPERSTVELPPPTHPARRRPSISSSAPSHNSHSHSRSVDSPASESMTFEAVYGADFQQVPPPVRVTRSKSLHASPTQSSPHSHSSHLNRSPTAHHHQYQQSPKLPPPPHSPHSPLSSRKRPESTVGIPSRQLSLLSLMGTNNGDLASGGDGMHENGESHIAKTLEKLTKARYKAEAGLSRRGFLPDANDSLVKRHWTGEESPQGDGNGFANGSLGDVEGGRTRGREEGYKNLESALESDSSADEEDLKRRKVVQNRIDGWMGPL